MTKIIRLTESDITRMVKRVIYEQSMGGMSSGQSFAQHSTSGAKTIIDKISKYTLAQFMEDLRGFLSSGTGMIIQIILEGIPGIGQIINVSAWSLLSLYDVTMAKSWNWMNIIVDIVGVITTGPGGKYIKNLLTKVKGFAGGTIEAFAAAVKKYAPKAFQYLVKTLKYISTFISKASSQFKQLLGYLGKYMKNTQIYKGLVKMEAKMSTAFSDILSKIETSFGENTAKSVGNVAHKTKHVGQHYAQHQAQHDLTHKVAGSVLGGGHHG